MTTITVEISKTNDLAALKSFIAERGLKYEVDEIEDFVYTDEIKDLLDNRYEEFKNGTVKMVSAEESKERIKQLLNGK